MIIDAHVHFWDPGALSYPWLAGLPVLRRVFGPADYASATAECAPAVDRVIVVEGNCRADQCLRETAYFESLADAEVPVAGIVAFVDLQDAVGRDPVLDALGRSPRVKGVRQNIQGEPAGFCLRPAFVAGVREVGKRGLVFDLCATHDQLGEVVELVRRCPETRFVLDHCGKPAIRDARRDPWCADIARLAACDNVWCKLSGLLTEAGARATDDDLRPYATHVVDCFGRDRMMFGSDWPVLTTAGRFADWHGFTRRFTADWSASASRAFYADTAAHVYGL